MTLIACAIPMILLLAPAQAQAPMPPPEERLWTAQADEYLVLADDWARPRNGERVVSMPSISRAVRAWMDEPGRQLLVIHPGGEAGGLWGGEMRDWLVSLGVTPDAIAVRPGSPRDDAIVLRLAR